MKRFMVAAAALAFVAAPAHAQMGKRFHGAGAAPGEARPGVDEKAYNSALDKIPEPKEKYDPWGVARPAEPSKDTPKKPKQTP
jgi:hypothetical protein